tara:strand:+ start:343 stop:504 length:162 start_codon:yes stop_codon:yes gene_type:complete
MQSVIFVGAGITARDHGLKLSVATYNEKSKYVSAGALHTQNGYQSIDPIEERR